MSSEGDVAAQQRDVWNAVSAGWANRGRDFERGAAVVTERLLRSAPVRTGQRILDVGSGIGEPAISAAEVVGPTGSVLGIDLAEKMVELAREHAGGRAGLAFEVGDVLAMDLPAGTFDVVLSRWGLMFAADRVAALRAIRRVLVPGGVLSAAVWGPPPAVPMIGLGFRVISGVLGLAPPPPGGPGPFTMSEPGLLEREVAEAGFAHVEVEALTVPFVLDSAAHFAAYTKDVLPPGMRNAVRERCGTLDAPEVWDAVAESAAEHTAPDGTVRLPSTSLCVRAEAPA
ncbi:class I SAM-dependent methyltransferase [Saccharopolyspora sp. CA-218241]|uniref:class I SAM-dependent methyltransferase n=1 Tax=Saccharopolyspora sp. CA-218241 TaxID=3240027 RepID=UPI003D997256